MRFVTYLAACQGDLRLEAAFKRSRVSCSGRHFLSYSLPRGDGSINLIAQLSGQQQKVILRGKSFDGWWLNLCEVKRYRWSRWRSVVASSLSNF